MYDMNRRQQLENVTPDVPDCFHNAVCSTLKDIVAQEEREKEKQTRATAGKRIWRRRHAVALALVLTLLLGAAALAAYHWQIFDALSFLTGATPKNAGQIMQSNLARVSVNHVDIVVQEAGYDGKTLFIQYAYRMKDVDKPLGIDPEDGTEITEGVYEEGFQLLYEHNVGWWIDQLWIDGKAVDMPGNSGAVTNGTRVPGEIIQSEFWRLDNENVKLSGRVEVSLPIGERQPLEEYRLKEHPEKYDEEGDLLLPEAGVVTFTLDTADMLNQVRVDHPNVPVKGRNVTAKATEVYYSPLLTYITLELEGDADAIAAYKAENGEGYYSEDGKNLLWEYGGMEVFDTWIHSLALVDGEGVQLFPDHYGNNGYGNEWAEFVYPHIENVPEELYLAPIENGMANMGQAIKLK